MNGVQVARFPDGGFVLHRVTLPDSAGRFSAWFSKGGKLLDAEQVGLAGPAQSRPVKRGGPIWAELERVGDRYVGELLTLSMSRAAHDWILNAQVALMRRAFGESRARWFLEGVSFVGIAPELADLLVAALPEPMRRQVQRTIRGNASDPAVVADERPTGPTATEDR